MLHSPFSLVRHPIAIAALLLTGLAGTVQAEVLRTLSIYQQEASGGGPLLYEDDFFNVVQGADPITQTLLGYEYEGSPEPFDFSFEYVGNTLEITALQTNTDMWLAPRFYYGIYDASKDPIINREWNVPPLCLDETSEEWPGPCTNELASIFNSTLPRIEGQTVVISLPGSVVPEPSTWLLMVAGLGAVGATVRARSRA
jgi:hypothetical protein